MIDLSRRNLLGGVLAMPAIVAANRTPALLRESARERRTIVAASMSRGRLSFTLDDGSVLDYIPAKDDSSLILIDDPWIPGQTTAFDRAWWEASMNR